MLTTKAFHELSALELYRILELRQDVFIVEQTCLFRDIDNHDLRAVHIFTPALEDAMLGGCVRVFGPGVTYEEASLGRIATAKSERRTGLGRALLRAAIDYLELHHKGTIRIGAQSYLERFYRDFGFVPDGEPYIEDGIPHIHMIRP
jgi:ElaA protein